jgi:hypothetical protein
MKMAGIREIRERSADYFGGKEPFFVMRHGKVSGVFVPLEDPDRLPDDWRREIAKALGLHLSKLLDLHGVSEKDILEDFRGSRRSRRGR